ncbi:MAG: tRNA lysidine(34) synthetase TilS [Planctomycetia bacterium]|nr:tRNA lysidine(34) synthetase TilS [Planctomycetia bacterium]
MGVSAGAASPLDHATAAVLAALSAEPAWLGAPSSRVVVAVSGGADSVGLLLGLLQLGPAVGRRLVVAHAEHDLRVEAPADRAFVTRLAEGIGIPVTWRRLTVRDPAAVRGEGLEGRARRLRYGFLADVARETGAHHVLVAHTADDQAETILHRVLRGTGVAGLAGMRRTRVLADGIALARPLLSVSRDTMRRFLAHLGQTWREDATNTDTSRARNFLRHEILSRCAAGPYPAGAAALVRLGVQAAGVADALSSAAGYLLDRHAERLPDGTVRLRAGDLATLAPPLVAEIFVALWRREGWPQRDMTEAHYRTLVRLLGTAAGEGRAASSRDLPGGIRAATGPGATLDVGPRQPFISTRR